MRARMSLLMAKQPIELREILLKDKPQAMLDISAKGTVPVLALACGQVIDESLDILKWAVAQNTNSQLNQPNADELTLVARNDNEFKHWLDRYKYHVGYPEKPMEFYRDQAMVFLTDLEQQLAEQGGVNLFSKKQFADIAIFPFVRQFAYVDKAWFDQLDLPHLQAWLSHWLETELFAYCMQKLSAWQPTEQGVIFSLGSA